MTSPPTTAGARVAVLLPHAYLGGTIRLLQNLVRHLAGRWPGPLVLAVHADHLPVIAVELEAVRRDVPGLEIRGFRWRPLEPDEARALAAEAGLTGDDYAVLYSTFEFKKVRLKYYSPEYRAWEDIAIAGAPLPTA